MKINVITEQIRKRIKSVYQQISEINIQTDNDFGLPGRLDVIQDSLHGVLDFIEKEAETIGETTEKLGLPSKKQLDTHGDTSKSYQQLKADVLHLGDIFGVDFSKIDKNSGSAPQINIQVLQSNVQNIENRNEVINNLEISLIKKEEIKKLFDEFERVAKDTSVESTERAQKLRTLFGKLAIQGTEVGILALRFAIENGLIEHIFGL